LRDENFSAFFDSEMRKKGKGRKEGGKGGRGWIKLEKKRAAARKLRFCFKKDPEKACLRRSLACRVLGIFGKVRE